MKQTGSLNTVVKIALLLAIGYMLWQWQTAKLPKDEVEDFARSACTTEIESRFDVSRVSTYAVNKNSNGYSVRATVTLKNGGSAKVNCLTNSHGGVRDVTIDAR